MPKFSRTSLERLDTCHRDLQMLFNHVITMFDCSIICGHRNKIAQDAAFRAKLSEVEWPNSKHNKTPSMAVDVAPYPIDWNDRERFVFFAGHVMATAKLLHYEGFMSHRLRWGGNWDNDNNLKDNQFDDLVHFELMGVY